MTEILLVIVAICTAPNYCTITDMKEVGGQMQYRVEICTYKKWASAAVLQKSAIILVESNRVITMSLEDKENPNSKLECEGL